ncbi:uncharacterized protein PB18E9.04c-like, partial [Pomacea canaliculata]|uniref:uncharacterized protein PB18E9.04c-like n=1 Tax=Pomacea canaliculata TaxID=400727 RepID=UPI000D72A3EA
CLACPAQTPRPALNTQSSALNTSTATSPITTSTFSPTTSSICSPTTSLTTSSTFSPAISSTISPATSSTISPATSSTISPATSSTISPTTSSICSPTTSLTTSSTFSPAISSTISPNTSPSTFPVTNGKSPSTSTTELPKYPGYIINSGGLTVSLNFTIKFNTPFNPDLHNQSSNAFREAKQNYTIMLTPIFNKTDSFDRIEITKFWNGSIGVAYTVVLHAFDVTDIQGILENDVEKNLTN